MRIYIFTSAFVLVAMGAAGMILLEKPESFGFLQGTLTLGGGLLICGIFSIQMLWHGVIGAAILSLLGAARGLGNLPGLVKFFAGDRSHGPRSLMEFAVTVICALLLLKVLRALSQERVRRMLETEE